MAMTDGAKRSVALVAPYAAWMALMVALPATAWAYAVRGAVTAALLIAALPTLLRQAPNPVNPVPTPAANHEPPAFAEATAGRRITNHVLAVLAGLLVFVIWIAPEIWLGSLPGIPAAAPLAAADSPYSPEVCGWALTIAKLTASAFVISAAEELFFRRWLVDFAGFWWMVALFAVEHGDRWAVGAAAGVVYGLVARRFGLPSAIAAHAVTNFALGLLVIFAGRWEFW
ncbi:MAG: hypothetical protein IJ983_02105 [Kiritimatiellae bacterium]|nr:hypothetical protein [Kiritimatiellia bacterium]